MKEDEGLCHLLCALSEGEESSLAKTSAGDGDEKEGREEEGEKSRQKTWGEVKWKEI